MDLESAREQASEVVQRVDDSLVITPEEAELLDPDPVQQFDNLAARLEKVAKIGSSSLGHNTFTFPTVEGSDTQITVELHVYRRVANRPKAIGAEWFMTDPSVNNGDKTRFSLRTEFLNRKRVDPSNPPEQQRVIISLLKSIEAVESLQAEDHIPPMAGLRKR